MRVTHIITRLIIGGAQENTVATVLALLRKPGLEVKLISGPTIGPEGTLEPAVQTIPGLFSIVPELIRPVHPPKDFIALHKLAGILREQRPQIVHTHSGKAGILGRLAAKRAGVPIIIHHIHGPSFGKFQGATANLIFTAAERHAARVTNHFFCSASAMARIYLGARIGTPEMFTRIFSGFNLDPFLQSANDPGLRQQLGLSEDHFVIGKIGRLFKLKGHADLLAAFARILPQLPRARLLFVGDGSLRGDIEGQARALGVAGKVVFAGLVPPAEVARYVGIMDCVAHLSGREALSRALPQALAAGKPIIAYDFDGADEVCREGENGFLIRTGDIENVAQKLTRLAGDPALRSRLGNCGREFVRVNFTVEKMVEDQYAVYRKLTAERGLPE
ncbi:MAG TPA: glycosyltransferase [Candidatus Acidoferrum sp.]|nr:glycosyltransferase [Candidatus Acidoferrum sp.]